jgi:hypothetical protein
MSEQDKAAEEGNRAGQYYRTRKEQIAAFKRRLCWKLSRKQHAQLSQVLRDAAMVGAAEERFRTLQILKQYQSVVDARTLSHEICAKSMLAVLGYEDE